jgi:hypothetical protein
MSYPELIVITRHAEKPDDSNDIDLSAAGLARARALVGFIPQTFGIPGFLFAASSTHHSRRPVETLEPFAEELKKEINTDYADVDFEALRNELFSNSRYTEQFILVAWHHEKIPSLCKALGAPQGSYPKPWPDDVFNLLIRLDYSNGMPPNTTQVLEPF